MTIPLLLALLLFSFILYQCRCSKLGVTCFFSTVLLFFLIATGFLPGVAIRYLQSDFKKPPILHWDKPSIIVLLGAGEIKVANHLYPSFFAYSRILKAMQLYHACRSVNGQCQILLSGGDPSKNGASEAEVYQQQLVNVPAEDVLLETKSTTTYEEAQYLQHDLASKPNTQIILVTSGFHLRRAFYIFQAFGIQTIPIASDYAESRELSNMGFNFFLMDLALHEYVGMAFYAIKLKFLS